jgi:hypothetical protein
MTTADGMAGWVGLRQFARSKGVDRERLLRHARKLDAGTGKILQRAARSEQATGERPTMWLLNVRRLEAAGGPTRAKIDEVVDAVPLQMDDLKAELRSLTRRVTALERQGAVAGPQAPPKGRSPSR